MNKLISQHDSNRFKYTDVPLSDWELWLSEDCRIEIKEGCVPNRVQRSLCELMFGF
jgi:hypothetical protein